MVSEPTLYEFRKLKCGGPAISEPTVRGTRTANDSLVLWSRSQVKVWRYEYEYSTTTV